MTEKIEIDPIRDEDSAELTRVMTRAFDDNAKRHLGEEKGGQKHREDTHTEAQRHRDKKRGDKGLIRISICAWQA